MWANVAVADPASSNGAWEPRLVVLAYRSREIVVKTRQLRVDGAFAPMRILREVVDSVNKALDVREALAARRLGNGDIVVIFQEYTLCYKMDNA